MVDNERENIKAGSSTEGPREREGGKEAASQENRADAEKGQATEASDGTIQKGRMSTGEYLLIGLSVLLILIVAGGGMFIWARYGTPGDGQETSMELSKAPLHTLKPFFVPLRPKAGSEKFLRVNISLELSGKHSKQFVKNSEKVRRAIVQILLTAVPKDLEYSHGKKALMDKMIAAINHSLEKSVVSGVRFTDVVIL
jgi:flagellar basal body-associated protein FliL